jgi:hypothetical protein
MDSYALYNVPFQSKSIAFISKDALAKAPICFPSNYILNILNLCETTKITEKMFENVKIKNLSKKCLG